MKNVLVSVRATLNISRESWPQEARLLDDGTEDGRVAALDFLEAIMREGEWSQYLDHMHGGEADIEVDG